MAMPQASIGACLRALWRGTAAVALLAVFAPLQALRTSLFPRALPGPLPRLVHRALLWILGVQLEVVGTSGTADAVVWTSNHLSYLDIPVLGSLRAMRFVAKQEVAGWPVFGPLASLQQTLYISRRPRDAVKVGAAFAQALRKGGVVVLFPEGTSSDGCRVLPFRSSILQVLMLPAHVGTQVQAVSLRLLQVDGRSADDAATRDLYAYHGDMQLLSHLRRFLQLRGARLQIVFHAPLRAGDHGDRRALALRLHAQVASGLATGQPAS